MLGSLIVYLKGMRIMMFQLSGYYYSENVDLKDKMKPHERAHMRASENRGP